MRGIERGSIPLIYCAEGLGHIRLNPRALPWAMLSHPFGVKRGQLPPYLGTFHRDKSSFLIHVHQLVAGEEYLGVLLPSGELIVCSRRQLQESFTQLQLAGIRSAAKGQSV